MATKLPHSDQPRPPLVPTLPRSDFRCPPYADSAPKVWKETIIHAFAVLTLAYATYYILWRWTSSLNGDALWFAVPLALAETVGLITVGFFVFNTWRIKRREPRPAPPGLSVDVFITTYDEPLDVILKTVLGAQAIRYPHRTHILDDGKRKDVRALAEELGIGYIRREGNAHAKAGNINHALGVTSGDFILQLDADHVPMPHVLDRLLGYFDDPELAFVQSPQTFYNTDGITSHTDEDKRRLWTEQNLFFSVIQPAKDHWGAAFFCGSCAVMRRAALEDIGGLSTQTITEDFETTIVLHSRGWRSAYHAETLAYGLAPNSIVGFHVQHLRWGQGTMQVWRKLNPLTTPGLTLPQRLCHFYSVLVYTDGLLSLIFYSAPLIYLFFGVLPIESMGASFLARWIPLYVSTHILSNLMARGTECPMWFNERNQMAKFWTHTRAVFGYFARKRLKFEVTPKGQGSVPPEAYRPQLLVVVLTVAALLWAWIANDRGWISYAAGESASVLIGINVSWAAWNLLLAAWVVRLSRQLAPKRRDHRFSENMPVRFRWGDGREEEGRIGLLQDINSAGAAFRTSNPLPPGSRIRLELPLVTRAITVGGTVVHRQSSSGKRSPEFVHGIHFDPLPAELRNAIELHCTHYAVPAWRSRYREQVDVFDRIGEWLHGWREVSYPGGDSVPITVAHEDEPAVEFLGVLHHTSDSDATVVLERSIEPGALLRFHAPGLGAGCVGRAVSCRPLEVPVGRRYHIGMRRMNSSRWPSQRRSSNLEKWMSRAAAISLSVVGFRRLTSIVACLLALGAVSTPGSAQMDPVIFGVAETDTEGTTFFLLGGSIATPGLGFGLGAGVLGYYLRFPSGAEATNSVSAIQPSVTGQYLWPSGMAQLSVGYLFVNGEENDTPPRFGTQVGDQDGFITGVQGQYWGSGQRSVQFLASYNWGAEYVWSRLRGTQQVATIATRPFGVGAEVTVQGTGDRPASEGYRALQIGAVAEYALAQSLRIVGAAGAKTDNQEETETWIPYVKLEFVRIP